MESRKDMSCFVIEGAERNDEGNYTICVTNPAGEDKAMLFIKIVGKGKMCSFILNYQLQSLTAVIWLGWGKTNLCCSRCARPA